MFTLSFPDCMSHYNFDTSVSWQRLMEWEMATHKFIVIKEGNEKGKQYKRKPFFSTSHTHTPGTFLLCWQLLLWRDPGAECGMAVAKHTEQDRGVL